MVILTRSRPPRPSDVPTPRNSRQGIMIREQIPNPDPTGQDSSSRI
jgi:hypothetical protein